MDIRGAIQADAHEKMVFAEKFSPFLGNGKAVCLDGVLYGDALLVVLSHRLRKEAEKIQPGQGWLPALKSKRNKAALVKFLKTASYQCLGCLQGHHAIFGSATVLLLIPIKAIVAAHIAKSGCGFYQKLKLLHNTSVFCNTVRGVLPTNKV